MAEKKGYHHAMGKDAFWALMAETKEVCGQDMDASVQFLKDRLISLGPEQAIDFHSIMCGYKRLAHQYGLWSAASILCEYGCTDDGFIDFRTWLIAQGKEVYLAALKDPDSLADVEAYGGCQFELLAYVGSEALEALTGEDAYDYIDTPAYDALLEELRKDICYGEGINYPYELKERLTYFPRLCAKCLGPEDIEFMRTFPGRVWSSSPEIEQAREGGPPMRDTPENMMTMGGM